MHIPHHSYIFSFLLLQFQDSEDYGDVVAVPQAKEYFGGDAGPILPVPRGIRPTLAKYRLEVRQE